MFGYARLGQIAGAIDDLMNEATGVADEAARARLATLVSQLRAEAACAGREVSR